MTSYHQPNVVDKHRLTVIKILLLDKSEHKLKYPSSTTP